MESAQARAAAVISALDEQDALDRFWALAYSRLGATVALQIFGQVKMRRPHTWNRLDVRAEGVPPGLLRPDTCFACGTGEYRLYWHHVIWIQHGGSAHPRNFVAICHACHRRVHPWLKPGNTLEQREGLYAAKDLIPGILAKLEQLQREAAKHDAA